MHKKPLMLLLVLFWAVPVFAQTPHVLSTSPAQNQLNVPVSTNISVTFDVDMDQITINDSTFVVNARSTGLHAGTITYDSPTKTATFDPVQDFDEGEVVTVVLTTLMESSGGTPLDSAYVWSFTSVVYDGSGTFAPQSFYAVGDGPYSVFSADLDGDGDLDLATANYGFDNVSVLLNCLPTGDCNGDHVADLWDVLHLISYLYKGGLPPDPLGAGGVDCSGEIELGDVLYLISYLYKGGLPPGCC